MRTEGKEILISKGPIVGVGISFGSFGGSGGEILGISIGFR